MTLGYRRKPTPALDSVDLLISNGTTALVGRNGSGKTSLFRITSTLLRRYDGTLEILGENPRTAAGRVAIRKQLGYLPQDFAFTHTLSVEDFVRYAAWLKGVPSTDVDRRVSECLDVVHLAELSDRKLGALSGGMLRRVGIAQAIVNDPKLVILDEPSSGLDPEQRISLRQLIADLGQERAVVVSTHLIDEAVSFSDSLIFLIEGKVAFAGSSSTLLEIDAEGVPGDTPAERAYVAMHMKHAAETAAYAG